MISPGVHRNPLPLADHRLHLDLKIISKSEVLIPSDPGRQGHRNIGGLQAGIVGRPLPNIADRGGAFHVTEVDVSW